MAPAAETGPLSAVLPQIIFGTGTFNTQYNPDPYALDTVGLVRSALEQGIHAFDTSPYYGPAEVLLGAALADPVTRESFPRRSYFLLTKAGRISSNRFDYSPAWIRQSVTRSLERLHTDYLDVVYCHDVEFVSREEALGAVQELRRLRDEEGCLRYVGISGYPLDWLCEIAEFILAETGEPIDIIQSYGNFTLLNTSLATRGVARMKSAGVDVVTNASVLGLGLLRHNGFPVGAEGDWHPASQDLRRAVREASAFCDRHGELIEDVATRFAMESWLEEGAAVGSSRSPAAKSINGYTNGMSGMNGFSDEPRKLGVTVIGVSNYAELTKASMIWWNIIDGLDGGEKSAIRAGRWRRDHEWSRNRRQAIRLLNDGIREILGDLFDTTWQSPPPGFVREQI